MHVSNSGTRQLNGNGKDKCFFLTGALKIIRRIHQQGVFGTLPKAVRPSPDS